MRLVLFILGLLSTLTATCGPARADNFLPRDLHSVSDMPGNRRAADSASRTTSDDGRVYALSWERSRGISASDALAALCPGHGHLAPLVEATAARRKLPAAVLAAVMRVESSCRPDAVNPRTHSYGLMGIKLDGSANVDHLEADELLDPATSLDLGARHLRRWTLACGSLAGGLSIYHGKKRCDQHRGDRYVSRVIALAEWARTKILKLRKPRS